MAATEIEKEKEPRPGGLDKRDGAQYSCAGHLRLHSTPTCLNHTAAVDQSGVTCLMEDMSRKDITVQGDSQ